LFVETGMPHDLAQASNPRNQRKGGCGMFECGAVENDQEPSTDGDTTVSATSPST
jgi:hypothetical protein